MNNLIKAFTKNVDVTVPELKEIQISSYDKNGLLIGEVQKLSPSQNAITLSSYTDHISVIPVLDNICLLYTSGPTKELLPFSTNLPTSSPLPFNP